MPQVTYFRAFRIDTNGLLPGGLLVRTNLINKGHVLGQQGLVLARILQTIIPWTIVVMPVAYSRSRSAQARRSHVP